MMPWYVLPLTFVNDSTAGDVLPYDRTDHIFNCWCNTGTFYKNSAMAKAAINNILQQHNSHVCLAIRSIMERSTEFTVGLRHNENLFVDDYVFTKTASGCVVKHHKNFQSQEGHHETNSFHFKILSLF